MKRGIGAAAIVAMLGLGKYGGIRGNTGVAKNAASNIVMNMRNQILEWGWGNNMNRTSQQRRQYVETMEPVVKKSLRELNTLVPHLNKNNPAGAKARARIERLHAVLTQTLSKEANKLQANRTNEVKAAKQLYKGQVYANGTIEGGHLKRAANASLKSLEKVQHAITSTGAIKQLGEVQINSSKGKLATRAKQIQNLQKQLKNLTATQNSEEQNLKKIENRVANALKNLNKVLKNHNANTNSQRKALKALEKKHGVNFSEFFKAQAVAEARLEGRGIMITNGLGYGTKSANRKPGWF